MARKKYSIGNFEFENYTDYQKGLSDVKKIYYITHEVDIYDPKVALNLYNLIREEEIIFYSKIGKRFYLDLVNIVMKHTDEQMNWERELSGARISPQTDLPKKILGIVCLVLACICFVWYFWTEYTNRKGEEINQELRQMKTESLASLTGLATNEGFIPEEETEVPAADSAQGDGAAQQEMPAANYTILPEYQGIYNQNNDFVGWLTIGDTNIDYPVMQTVEDPTYYLRRNFNGEDDNNGTLFIDYRANVTNRSTNIIVYGHNMRSSMMFGQLKNYQQADFYQQHKQIQFDTIYEKGTYEVFAVCLAEVKYQDDDSFRYYNFIQADTQEEFDSFIDNIRAMAVQFDEGVVAYGDSLLTLSTCNNYTEDGRLFIVAKKCSDAQ